MYITVDELREHYTTDSRDEFNSRSDAALRGAIERASATIDRYRPQITPSPTGIEQLRSVCYPISRAYAHDELLLDDNHPVIREYKEALGWLKMLSDGKVSLSSLDDKGNTTTTAKPVTIAPKGVFYGD